ncbi:cytochrome b-c1 complex subunit 6, partial [Striga asiatica]
ADYEPVDPKAELEDRCKAPCTRPLKEYQYLWSYPGDRHAIKELKVMNLGTSTVPVNTLTTGVVWTNASLLSYFRSLSDWIIYVTAVFGANEPSLVLKKA